VTKTELVAEIGRWLNDPIVIVALCAIFGGAGLMVVAWAFTREEHSYADSQHRRPMVPERWHRDPFGGPATLVPARSTQAPARHRFDTMGMSTTRLGGYPTAARAMVRDTDTTPRRLAPDWVERMRIEDDEETSGSYRAGETGRVRRAPEEGLHEEEGSADRERGELAPQAFEDGEEGSEDAGEARPEVARWFRNAVTGEYIFLDEYGRRVDFNDA
jgi:hypothetical protein